ncbi:hypothetical protein E3V39_12405 [Gammaproteobacteria bacterium LSUCC0112]|nr:hypothetical protein E3V39_12405 [Gammaproteobacteria bacterium LSUCC0112]
MERIQFNKTFTVEKPERIKSERADLINQFLTRLNAERVGTKWKPLTARAVAIKLGHIPTEDLYYCFKQCSHGGSFGKVFFGMLKNKS